MASYAHVALLSQALRLLPSPVLRMLDAWSYRLARRRAAQRRIKERSQAAPAPGAHHAKS